MPTPSSAIMRALISFHAGHGICIFIPHSLLGQHKQLRHWGFTALKFSIISELINATPFLKAKRLPEQITQPAHQIHVPLVSAGKQLACTGAVQEITGWRQFCCPYPHTFLVMHRRFQRCSEREEECFALLLGISNRAL